MHGELACLFAAIRFFTRLPVPAWVGHSQQQLDQAARYFPLVGAIVGAIGAAVTLGASKVLGTEIGILLGMAATVLATGAFHEDGFADTCDGFGGGWDRTQILAIMKDSRIGSYGAVGIALLLLTKFVALGKLDPAHLAAALIAAHAASRFAAVMLIFALDYVREEQARAKPLARRVSASELMVAAAFGLAPALLLPPTQALVALGLAALATLCMGRYFRARIGGYTGDCLGAVQQVAELAFYLGLLCAFS